MGRAPRNLSGITKARLEAFSDGVLAIVITLLAIELRPPEVDEGQSLAGALWEQWPSYLAYLLAFAQIGVIWLNHHRLFDQVRVVDGKLLLLNLNLLMWITLIPFPTALVAEHLRDGGEATRTAVAVFSGTLFVTSIGFTALYAWITHDDRLVHSLPSRHSVVRGAHPIRGGAGCVRAGRGPCVPRALRSAGDPCDERRLLRLRPGHVRCVRAGRDTSRRLAMTASRIARSPAPARGWTATAAVLSRRSRH